MTKVIRANITLNDSDYDRVKENVNVSSYIRELIVRDLESRDK